MPLPYSQPTRPGRLSATRLINLPPSHTSSTCERVLFPPVNAVQIAVCVLCLGYYSVHGKVWGVGRVRSVKVKLLFFKIQHFTPTCFYVCRCLDRLSGQRSMSRLRHLTVFYFGIVYYSFSLIVMLVNYVQS